MTRNCATNRAWVGKDAAERDAGVEITKWAPLSRPVTTTQQDGFPPKKPVPARPAAWTKKVQPRSDTKRIYGDLSSHLADYHPWIGDFRRKASVQAGRDPVEARGGTFAGITTTADSYKPPVHGPKHVPYQSVHKPYENRFANYESTYNMSYMPFECSPAPSMRPPQLPPTRTLAKTGTSSYAEEYYPKPLNPKVVPWQNLQKKNMPAGSSGHTGSSTHNADFIEHPTRELLRLDLGVQISNRPYKHGGTGGRFQLMIPAGSAAPTTCEMSFTTVVDAQQVAKIVVVARPQDEEVGAELGHFQLSDIKAADVGVPRVKVTFTLHKENLLKVSATYEQGHRTRNLILKDRTSVRGLHVNAG